MRFTPTPIPQLFIVELEPATDERGFFARAWCSIEFADHGLVGQCLQANLTFNSQRGTLRGMHYQSAPDADVKLVRVIRGTVHDVVLDLRHDSPMRGQWYSAELS